MRQAIVTKFISPTNYRGSRIVASAAAGKITHNWDYSIGIEANHAAAAMKLVNKFGWNGNWIGGGMPNDTGYCFVDQTGADIVTP
jgi:hypothetical protein